MNGELDWFNDDAQRAAIVASRLVRLEGEVTKELGGRVITQLFYLDKVDSSRPIQLYVDAPGGVLAQEMSIFATIDRISAPVHTWCRGMAGGAAVAIVANGMPGRRAAVPRCRFVMSRLTIADGARPPEDAEMEHARDMFAARLSRQSNLTYDEVRDILRDGREWTVDQAIEDGIVDHQTPTPWD